MDHQESLYQEIQDFKLILATLSSPTQEGDDNPTKITIRPILVKSKHVYQVSRFFKARVMHLNLTPKECLQLIVDALPTSFLQGIFETSLASYHVLVNKIGALKVLKKAKREQVAQIPMQHNRSKNFHFPEGRVVPFLVALGIMKSDGRVPREKFDKFRQINHFIELVENALDQLPKEKKLNIIDFGSGKSYLTFALHYYLNHLKKQSAVITGVDLKSDVIAECRQLAERLEEPTLQFVVGSIQGYLPREPVDMVITLHACDLATDAAIKNAVDWKARVILTVPCCQHELFSQVKCRSLDSLLRYGILKERFCALVTDAMRAELLTKAGYSVDVIEFIDMEHTSKNLMIRAIKDPSVSRASAADERYEALKEILHISPWLEDHLLTTKGEAEAGSIES